MSRPPSKVASNLRQFYSLLEEIPWFLRLGRPHRRDRRVGRIHSWEQWPGPEAWGSWFGRWSAVVLERIEEQERRRSRRLEQIRQRIGATVERLAIPNVPLYNPREDPWYGPTCCVGDAAYITELVGWHVFLQRPLPERLYAEWTWFVDGHWPCSFAEKPPDYGNESLEDFPVGKLLVF